MTKAELEWLMTFVDNYKFVFEAYPELFSPSDEDDLKVVTQILQEKLNEQ
jgi:hypothetical protein